MGNFFKKFNVDILFYALIFLFLVGSLVFSTFRDVIKDEAIYLHETFLMSELLKNGIWFGDYAVGLHGFLFKLPPAIVFMFTGPSVFVVTFYNILLACLALFFFYKFLKEAFGWRFNAILALGLFMANFHFILTTPTYLREMPSLFVVSILLYGIFKNWKPWILGLIFLLLLDAKEYLFFMFGLGYFIWIVVKYFKARDFKNIFLESIQLYGLSLIYIALMFTTSVIPVNMFIASTIGLIETGTTYVAMHFSTDTVAMNLIKDEEVKTIFQFVVTEDMHIVLQFVLNFLNAILSYIGKLLYPRTFSFLSVPKVIMLPAVYMAFRSLREKGKGLKKILSILFFTYLAIYLLRVSHGRYLLPIVPLIAIYFVQFIHYPFEDKKELIRVLIATFLFMSFGFYFEASYLIHKIIIETFLFACIAVSVLKPFAFSKYFYLLLQKMTIVFCILAMLGTSLLFYMTQGQMGNYILFGENREIKEIIEIVPENEKFWINNTKSSDLMKTKMELTYAQPEWKWELAEFVPKKDLLKVHGDQYLYNDFHKDMELFREYFYENEIKYVVFVEPTIDEELFEYEYLNWAMDWKLLDFFKEEPVLVEQKVQELQNKKVYLFKVDFE